MKYYKVKLSQNTNQIINIDQKEIRAISIIDRTRRLVRQNNDV